MMGCQVVGDAVGRSLLKHVLHGVAAHRRRLCRVGWVVKVEFWSSGARTVFLPAVSSTLHATSVLYPFP